jgi:FSR family fosmidomycin resistance protein-like MFS transporter
MFPAWLCGQWDENLLHWVCFAAIQPTFQYKRSNTCGMLQAQMKITDNQKTNIKVIFGLTLVHFVGDFYSSFSTPLIPSFVDTFSLSMAQVGVFTGIIRFLAFIVQPSVGYFADRYQTRIFALGGLAMTIVFIPLAGAAPSFYLLVLLFALGSMGSSMFHPAVTGMVPMYGGRNTGFSMSIFNTGGTLAFGIGPVFITWFVVEFGLTSMPMTMLIGIVPLIYLYRVLPVPVSEGMQYSGFMGSIKETLGAVWKPLTLIWMVMVMRAAIAQSFITFMTVLLADRGYSLIAIGSITSIFIVAGTFSGLLAGFLSDRIDFKKIFFVAHGMMVPALLVFLNARDLWVYPAAALGGFFALATLPIGVVMAQELAPKGRSMVASLMMGFAYGLGGAFSPLVGKIADLTSIQATLFVLCFMPLATVGVIWFFPRIRGQ